jgi:hypothetical protein
MAVSDVFLTRAKQTVGQCDLLVAKAKQTGLLCYDFGEGQIWSQDVV